MSEHAAIWTDRRVEFTPYPRTSEEDWDALFDALPDHYWERPDIICRFFEPGVASCGRVIFVFGLPWWMPKWWARRTVASVAAANGVGGDARYVIERTVLL